MVKGCKYGQLLVQLRRMKLAHSLILQIQVSVAVFAVLGRACLPSALLY